MKLLKFEIKQITHKIILLHILCWILFIAYELTTVYYSIGEIENPYVYVVYYAINISFFYLYVKILDNSFREHISTPFAALMKYILLLNFYLTIKFAADYFLANQKFNINNPFVYIQGFFIRNITRGLYFTALATFYWAAGHISYFRRQAAEAEKRQLIIEKENAELEAQLTKSRNAYLQQQINPHMLFNALNFVYNSAQKYSDDAANCIWLLSEIMRFSLEEAGSDGKIKLKREAEQIENLVEINRYRFAAPLHLNLLMEGDFNRYKIIPLILLTLTENIFKHGNLTEISSPAVLKLTVSDNGQLTFHSRNLKKSKNGHVRQRKAVGLENIHLRMDSFYKDNYELEVNELGDFFELTLTLKL